MMTTQWSGRLAGAALITLGLVAAVAPGCEKGDVLAPPDSTMTLTAIPSNVELDQSNPDTFADVTIEARILNSAGFPASEVDVVFSTTGGQLTSGGAVVQTNGSGVALDTLRIRAGDPDSITVTARSGSVTQTTTITVNCPDNEPPVAVITVTSGSTSLSGAAGVPVSIGLSGTSSTDVETAIASYAWDCGNGTTGAGSTITCSYTVLDSIQDPDGVQTYTATLTVTDEGTGTVPFTCQATSLPASLTITVTRVP
jgi:hypothetical protein